MKAYERTAGNITYTLTRKNVKNINLRIHGDGTIAVSAPIYITADAVDRFVLSKSEFIEKAKEKLKNKTSGQKEAREYINGEKYLFLGREITLDLRLGEADAYIEGNVLHISVINAHSYAIRKKAVNGFFMSQCEKLFAKLIEKYYAEFRQYGISLPALRIKDMKSRWGSCIPSKGIITLNSRLISVPMECIEYVVVHEYCHYLELNHSPRFYAHVAHHMPDWKERRKRLNEFPA